MVNVLHIIIYLSFIIINIINHKLIIKLQLSGKPYGHETPYARILIYFNVVFNIFNLFCTFNVSCKNIINRQSLPKFNKLTKN